MEQIMIALSGPPGIGKTWLGDRLEEMNLAPTVLRHSIRSVIWDEFKATHLIFDTSDYEKFRDSEQVVSEERFLINRWQDAKVDWSIPQPNIILGRHLIIDFAERKRAMDIHYWDDRFIQTIRDSKANVIIHDSLRMPEEQEIFFKHFEVMTIVMCPTRYSVGQQYDNDSGYCLAPHGGFRTTNSDRALALFQEKLTHAAQAGESATLGTDFTFRRLALGRLVDRFGI